jgi:hypothetical protein
MEPGSDPTERLSRGTPYHAASNIDFCIPLPSLAAVSHGRAGRYKKCVGRQRADYKVLGPIYRVVEGLALYGRHHPTPATIIR